jgi:hypothetical protein
VNGLRGLVIATAAAFIVGCSAGLMGGILFMRFGGPGHARDGRHGGRPPWSERRGPGGPGREQRMVPMLERDLDLTPEQARRVEAHLDRARREHAAVRESVNTWIERELTPAQRERWKQMQTRFERERRGRRGGPPPDRR